MAKKTSKETQEPTVNDQFEEQLKSLGIGDSLKLADEYDNDVECLTTGFPGLDRAIGGENSLSYGFPKRRHSEIYSKKEHAGKTSLALAIGVTWQQLGQRVAIIDLEPSVTKAYLKTLGYIVERQEADAKGLVAVHLMQPEVRPEDCETDMHYLEEVLDIVAKAADVFDLVIVDSVDAMVSQLEAEKKTADNDQAGGIAKKMRSWFRKNTTRRAHITWLNHASQQIGSYGGPSYYTSGGKAVPRYSSVRLEVTVIEKLAEGDKDPYGFKARVQLVKNRLGPNWRYTDLTYIFGEGFSKEYDYFETAFKLGMIAKSGGWFYIPGEGKNEDERKKNSPLKVQGKLNMYYALKDNPEIFQGLKTLINGEDVHEVGVEEGSPEAARAAEAE